MATVYEIMNQLSNIRCEMREQIALLTLNRPEALNALNSKTLEELDLIFESLENTEDILGVIITGEGRAFAAGADIVQMKDYKCEDARNYAGYAQKVFNRIEALEKPVIAAVNGYALGGGCEVSLSCDFRIASEKAVFGQPEVDLGVIPCFGGTQRLTRLVGIGRAKELIYTGRKVKAQEAYEIGLVNKVVPGERLEEETMDIMRLIAEKAPMAVRYAKVAITKGADMDLGKGLELEKDIAGITFGTDDKQEGMEAFLEKRKAKFRNR